MISRHIDQMPEPTPPGEMLLEEFLVPLNMTQSALALKMGVDVQVVNGICRGRRAITAHTAILLSKALETTPQFWMNQQNAVDLWEARKEIERRAAPAIRTAARPDPRTLSEVTLIAPPTKAGHRSSARQMPPLPSRSHPKETNRRQAELVGRKGKRP